jgi:hypothetical protein
MFAGPMRKDYALSLIDRFPPLPKGRPFPRIDPAQLIADLRKRVNDPVSQDQGAASLCCPASFFYCVLNYKPELYVQYVIDLFTTGKARIGSLEVKPGMACRVYQPPKGKIAGVDWVALASLRDSYNAILDVASVDDDIAARTREGEVAKWFRQVGYAGVRDDSNIFVSKGRKEIEAFERDARASRDVCLFVHTNILYDVKNKMNSHVWNHCVVVDEPPEVRNGRISLNVYTYGGITRIPTVGTLSVEEFSRNFYGYVSGQPTFK